MSDKPIAVASASALARKQAMQARLLSGPIVPNMLRLALPTIVVLVVQAFVGVAETYFVSFLGTEAIAGVALVFPILMLMQMMSNGAVGGGVASAVARALGSHRSEDAASLVWHAVIVACVIGLVFSIAALLSGTVVYRAMGGSGAVLAAALSYSNIVFAGAVPLWIVSLLSASLRGSGDARTPALVIFGGILILIPLSPALIFGWGPFPRLGIAGAGTAVVTYYVLAAIALIVYMRSARSPLRLSLVRLEGRLFKQILGVGLLSAVGTLQTNLTVTCVTGIVGLFGSDAIAGYGIASRLDYLQVPILFGFGTSVVTMVGVNIGAGQIARARRIAWTAGCIAAGFTELLGLVVLIFPHAWIGLFSNDPKVLASGTLYLQAAAPVYGAVGLGMLLYFASQGASRVLWPVLAGTVRMVVAVLIGWYSVVKLDAGLTTLFHCVAAGSLLYGLISAIWMFADSWGVRRSVSAEPVANPAE